MRDEELIDALKEKKHDALDSFIKIYGKLCYGVIWSILKPNNMESEVDKCFNDVLLIIWYNARKIESRKGKFRNFIISLCKFKSIDILRSKENYGSIENVEIENKERVEEIILKDEEKAYLYKAIQDLKSPDKEIFTMRYIDDLDIDNISERLKLERGTIYTRISRGKKKIKDIMEGYYSEL
ncbi:MAG: sigma-70 family RNA polymerase sigma factor [Clostridium sp.]|uniref:sigma-70 family RNA polymerase sigma factor n=1 Tax=Clostridium sp. TaxID=1506 RepID=UPI003F3149E4